MDDAYLQDIGKRIQNRRKQKGYTQEQLADMMNVSVQMISNLERGNKAIRIDNLVNLSKILNVSTDYILTGKETVGDMTNVFSKFSGLSDRDRKIVEVLIEMCATDDGI